MFPDAKTERGVKHIKELVHASEEGYSCYIIFVVQMENVKYFTPNNKMHKELGDALIDANDKGVKVLAYDTNVTIDSLEINKSVKVVL